MTGDQRIRESRPRAFVNEVVRVADTGCVNSDENFCGLKVAEFAFDDLEGLMRSRADNCCNETKRSVSERAFGLHEQEEE